MWKRDTSPKPSNEPTKPLPEPLPASPAPSPIETRSTDNVMSLGKSITIKGELSASEDLTIYGQMEGSITLPDHTLTIGPQADVRAEIKASTVVIMGAVSGNVTASKKVEVRATGSVTGDIRSPRIVIADGAQLLTKVQTSDENTQGARRPA